MTGCKKPVMKHGQEGLQKLQDHHPDLVISDVWMPEMDGYDFCRAVRNSSDASIIMMTGVPQEAAVLREKKLDIDDYVIKPIEMVDFMRLISCGSLKRFLKRDKLEGPRQRRIPPGQRHRQKPRMTTAIR